MSAQGEAARRLGRYELITRIGQGGMAEVQLALQRGPAGFEKLVVVKLVHDNLATQKTFVDMLLDEARLAALVKHPNVVDIYDLGEANGRYFIAMEYLEGEPLLAVLRAGREGKRLDPLSTGRLIADTAEGLDAAHELRSMTGEAIELVHHDISLGNIVVLYTGQVKLVDFGVAKATQSSASKKVQGKFSYMAPEKLQGQPGDRRSDIFSLGCVMWEALTLKRLFRGGNDAETMQQVLELPIAAPSAVNAEVAEEYDPIVMRALDRDPAKRQQTAKELAVEIEELLRKRGYGAKNDRIAKYMQETFKAHIDARKKLVQEVVSKGEASAEVVDAAFDEPVLASGSPLPPGTSPAPVERPSAADFKAVPRYEPALPVDLDLDRPTELSASPFEVLTPQPAPPAGDDEPPPVPRPTPIDRLRGLLATPMQRRLAALAAVAAVLAIVAIATRSSTPAAAKSAKHPAFLEPPPIDAVVAAVEPPAAAPIAAGPSPPGDAAPIAEAPTPGDGAPIAEAPHDGAEPHRVAEPHHVAVAAPHAAAPAPSAEQLFQKAFQAFVRGDTKDALALLKTATGTNPGYAPTWRLLGQIYKKLGDSGQARTAFTRYLALAPTAGDARAIRKELEP